EDGIRDFHVTGVQTCALPISSSLLLQALPLMLLMFLLFPRIAPLWSLPVAKERGVTGLAESMSPYDMVELSRSSELAFRVTFERSEERRVGKECGMR